MRAQAHYTTPFVSMPLGYRGLGYTYLVRQAATVIAILCFAVALPNSLRAQCDTKVSGIFTYCNSFNGNVAVNGYFVGFRVHDPTGASMNVVDLYGNAITNNGKRINDINTQNEPANITVQALQIGGGADSLDYWYFGPYANGDSFNIALIDINGLCDTIFVGAGVYDCTDMTNGNTDPFACEPPGNGLPVPLYYLDFSNSAFIVGGGGGGNENVDNVFLIMKRSRERTCCDVGGNSVSCIELIVTLDENDIGLIIDDVGSGSTGGEIYADTLHDFECTGDPNLTYPFQQAGGQSADIPLCLPSGATRDYIILSCKPGANETGLSIDVIENIEVPPLITQANCDAQLNVLHVDDAIWFSPDDPNLDNLVTCTPDSTICTFQYNSDVFGEVVSCVGDTFTYIVGRSPMIGACIPADTILYDTTYVVVFPELAVQIDAECDVTGDSLILTALVTGSGIACGMELLWSTGDTSATIVVPVSDLSYGVTVTGSWMPEELYACAISDIMTATGILNVDCNLPPDSIASCYNGLPPADTSQVQWEGCNETATVFVSEVSNGGAGCVNDTLIYARHYIIDADGSLATTLDRDTCTQLFKFVDIIPPVILSCPTDVTLSCNSDTSPASLGVATASDNCDPAPGITFTDSQVNVSCPHTYVLQRTWQAADNCGNTARCIQRITFMDTIPPEITCPADVTVGCAAGTLPDNTGNPTATDNCDNSPGLSFSDAIIPGACPSSFTINRRWIAVDECFNRDTCFQLIQVTDTLYPIISCPPDITVLYPASTAPANTGMPVASDACSVPVVEYQDSLIAGTCVSLPAIRRTWTANDGCGHSVSCVQWITINDNGNICGIVEDDLGAVLSGVVIELWVDVNENQQLDSSDVLLSPTSTTDIQGQYCFSGLRPCHYLVVEQQPENFGSASDYDHSPDPDGVDTIGGPNNTIPVVLGTGENDLDNNFIDIRCVVSVPPLPFDTVCHGGSTVFQLNDPGVGTIMIEWDFGSGSTPASASGLGPHIVAYDTTAANQGSGADVIITVWKEGCPAFESVVSTVTVNPYPMADINAAITPLCYYAIRNFQPSASLDPQATYEWNFGTAAVPATATGYGPHAVYYTATGTKSVTLTILPNAPGAQCPDSANISFNVISCPGQILGFVRTTENDPVVNVNLKLYADQDTNGIADNGTVVRNVFTNSVGSFSMASIIPGNYVIIQTQPVGWITADDYDASDDGDIVPNADSLDNLIPCTILPGELDTMNIFIEFPQPATISGAVFMDSDNDQLPDAGEGLDSVLITLYPDTDLDGIADTSLLVASTFTSEDGSFSLINIPIGNYVLVETTPDGYLSVRDYDATGDGDLVLNTDTNNDTIPVSLSNGEHDGQNYFIDAAICSRVVTSLADAGYGTLRYNLACADAGDTITFHQSIAGDTITITSAPLMLDRSVVIQATSTPGIVVASAIDGLFIIPSPTAMELRDITIISGLSDGTIGAAFDNAGMLLLHNILIVQNPLLNPSQPLLWNRPGSSLTWSGYSLVQPVP